MPTNISSLSEREKKSKTLEATKTVDAKPKQPPKPKKPKTIKIGKLVVKTKRVIIDQPKNVREIKDDEDDVLRFCCFKC